MTYQQPGAYAGMPAYPGGPGMPPPKPPTPGSVLRAFQCMLAGAVLSAIGVAATLTQLGSIRSAFEKGLSNDDSDMVDSLVTATIVAAVVIALIEIGLWLWMAFAAKAGKNYARIVGTVFFGLNAAGTLFSTAGYFATAGSGTTSSTFASSDTVLGQIVDWLTFAIGLAAVVLLWRKSSSEYFKPAQFYPATPYGYPGYGYPGYGYPGYPPNAAPNMPGAPQQAPQGPQSGPQSGPPQQG
jgi:multisubunit Na+/H+ antiporter MnhC subunit